MMKIATLALLATTAQGQFLNRWAENYISTPIAQPVDMMFNEEDLMAHFVKANLKGEVAFTQCDDDAGVFTMDALKTKVSPNPVSKGDSLTFTLAGIVSNAIEVMNIHVVVLLDGVKLHTEDHKQDNKYTSDYSYDLAWKVPGFAPSGTYGITLTGVGNAPDAGVTNGNVLCVQADMKL